MKNRLSDEDIFRVAAETIEVLALMSLVPREESLSASGPTESAHVDFTGPASGSLSVSISPALLPELAANMLGEFDAARCSINQRSDALKELANVICGNILPILGGPEAIFHVGTPVLNGSAPAPEQSQGIAPTAQAELFLDQGTLRVNLYVEEESVV